MSTYTPVASQTLSASASSVTFSNIPQGYTDIEIVIEGIAAADSGQYYVTLNGDVTYNNYSTTQLGGDGTSAFSQRYNSGNFAYQSMVGWPRTSRFNSKVFLQNYSNSTTYKTFLWRHNAAGTYGYTVAGVNLWRNTAAITSITITCTATTFSSGTMFSLYGIQAGTPKAQGGNIVTTDGTYWYHAFTASGTFTPSSAITADVLVVAGGGAGGGPNAGGGGGAGGLVYQSSRSISANSLVPVIIGAGGATTSTSKQNSGSNSTFDTITANGGGSGGYYGGGVNGGSGGGGSYAGPHSSPAGTATQGNSGGGTGYGNNGGVGSSAGNQGGAGGGGAGAVGGNGSGSNGGAGGAGLNTWATSMLSPVNLGVSGYVAGGGGGAIVYGGTGGAGGSGGGGSGGSYGTPTVAPTSGTINTGSGGGGAGNSASGAGGSGLVIIRYAV